MHICWYSMYCAPSSCTDFYLSCPGEMNVLSQSMGTSIRQQNNSLRRMNSKQETLKDNTLLVRVCVCPPLWT